MHSNNLLSKKISRRAALRMLASASIGGLASLELAGCESFGLYPDYVPESPGLGERAARHGRLYGAAVKSRLLDWDPAYARALRQEVKLLVPEWELKWDAVHPAPDRFDFSGYRRILRFAQENRMAVRGHTLVWYLANPKWLEPALTDRATAEKILQTHIARVIEETAPVIRNWDVVNEALDPYAHREDGLRENLWLKALGPEYIPLAFQYAHAADPGLTLVYNDYRLENGTGAGYAKRRACLRMLEKFRKDGVPVHALGLQSHLQAGIPLGGADFTGFLKEIRALGLNVYVTELDLDLRQLSGRIDEKIKFAQNYVKVYLDMLQESGGIDMLITWGISDKYSWLRNKDPDLAGALPLDARFKRGALWETVRKEWAES